MEIHLLRHTSVKGVDGMCYGQSDVELSDDFLTTFGSIKPDQHYNEIISSPLRRCVALADFFKFEYTIDARLMEFNFGTWEMKRWSDIAEDEFGNWHEDYVNGRPPEGESLLNMQKRVLGVLAELKVKYPQGKVLLITHAGVIRIISSYIMNIRLEDLFSIKVGYGELKKLQF